ncbi:MAG: hypothetical protein AB7V56_16675 [Candidatus Nitrosocosmicus sp.]
MSFKHTFVFSYENIVATIDHDSLDVLVFFSTETPHLKIRTHPVLL